MEPLVGIVIPCYNYGVYIEEAVDSVLKSTYKTIEIIIVDDGSTDLYTIEVLSKMEAKPLTKVVRRVNGGLSAARNTGIRYTQAQYILTLDADDKIESTFIEKAVWILEHKNDVAYVYSLVQLFGEENKIWRTFRAPLSYLKFRNVVPATIVMRKECWEAVGGYDESMRDGYEDWEFILRLAKSRFFGFHINETLFYYRKHKGSMLEGSKKKDAKLKKLIISKHPDMYNLYFFQFLFFIFKEILKRAQNGSIIFSRKVVSFFPPSMKEGIKKRFKNDIFSLSIATETNNYKGIEFNNIEQKSKKNIMIILPWLKVGGVEKVFLQIISSLCTEYQIILVTTKKNNHPWHELFQPYVKAIYHIGDFLETDRDRYDFLIFLIKKWSINLIHLSNTQFGYNISPFIKKKFPKIPIIDTLHMEEPWAAWDYFSYNIQYQSNLDRTIVLTKSQAQSLLLKGSVPKNKLIVIPNGIKCEQDTSHQKQNNIFIVAFIARLARQKQPKMFLRIAKEFKNSKAPIKFLMVGEGELGFLIRFYRKLWGLNKKVQLHPFSNDINKTLSQVNVLLIPSLREGMPMIGLEAMSQGIPIIAPNVPGWNDIVKDGETGYLCNDVPEEYAEKIIEIYEAPATYCEMSRKSVLHCCQDYSLNQTIQMYRRLYDDLINNGD
ncbi:glycosyltransferase [Paenibacillus oleatilyticus]|uniref:Glycosyltransferase n=1 Tax=Paenibacillus oleatilyticus TaxID=2594886 RepID=A0ABV4V8N9_9BACL